MSNLTKYMSRVSPNVYMMARLGAGYRSREKAVANLPISETTLTRIESGRKEPSVDEITAMARTYGRYDLLHEYCLDICPVGKEINKKNPPRQLCPENECPTCKKNKPIRATEKLSCDSLTLTEWQVKEPGCYYQ